MIFDAIKKKTHLFEIIFKLFFFEINFLFRLFFELSNLSYVRANLEETDTTRNFLGIRTFHSFGDLRPHVYELRTLKIKSKHHTYVPCFWIDMMNSQMAISQSRKNTSLILGHQKVLALEEQYHVVCR